MELRKRPTGRRSGRVHPSTGADVRSADHRALAEIGRSALADVHAICYGRNRAIGVRSSPIDSSHVRLIDTFDPTSARLSVVARWFPSGQGLRTSIRAMIATSASHALPDLGGLFSGKLSCHPGQVVTIQPRGPGMCAVYFHPTLRQQITDELRAEILSGQLPPGQPVVERRLASRFGVSHAPVREALLQLAQEGLIHLNTNRVARVAPKPPRCIRELFIPICQSLESYALRSVFPVLGAQDFARWRELLAQLQEACATGDARSIAELDHTLHFGLIEGVVEADLLSTWRAIFSRARLDPQRTLEKFPQPTWIYEQHRSILEHCRQGNLEAAVGVLEVNIASELAID